MLRTEEGHDPLTDEEIDDKHEDQRWKIPDNFDIAPGDEAIEETVAHPKEPHNSPQEGGEHRRPETQLDRRQESLHECSRSPVCPVHADKVLENHRPLPVVSHLHPDAVDDKDYRGQDQSDEHGIEQREANLLYRQGAST